MLEYDLDQSSSLQDQLDSAGFVGLAVSVSLCVFIF